MQGKPPANAMWLLVHSAFGSGYALEDCLIKAIPIFLIAPISVGLTFRLRSGTSGAEGNSPWVPWAQPGAR